MKGSKLTLEAVSKYFPTEATLAPVVSDFSLEIEPGQIVSLVGPSGCGKSTLLRLISGLDRDYAGRIEVAGSAVTGPNPTTGLMFQEPRLFPWLDVTANIAFGLPAEHKNKKGQALVQELLEQVGVAGAAKLLPRQLSGGMAQRVALARALASEPGLLLLDEPFSAVDAFTRMRLQDLLLRVWQRYQPTLLLVTHDLEEALYLSDRIVVLTDRPARIQHIYEIEVPRPRDRRHPELLRLRSELLGELHLVNSVEMGETSSR